MSLDWEDGEDSEGQLDDSDVEHNEDFQGTYRNVVQPDKFDLLLHGLRRGQVLARSNGWPLLDELDRLDRNRHWIPLIRENTKQ